MISFIVIGKNEGWKITKCIKSIQLTIEMNRIISHEIIYVDSDSTDDSIERVKKFQAVKIFKLKGHVNAAIARNLGADQSKGDILFFIDGDMELVPENFKYFYDPVKNQLSYPFISGNFLNYYYNKNGDFLSKQKYHNLTQDEFQLTTGGIFLINKELWRSVGSMRPIFRRSQDLDLGLRLSAKGIKLLRKKEIITKHHTIAYDDLSRFWSDLLKGNFLYRGLLYKYNLVNKYIYSAYIKKEVSIGVLIFVLVLITFHINAIVLLLYPISLILKIILKKQKIRYIFMYFITDLNTIISLLFFWPKSPKVINYDTIK